MGRLWLNGQTPANATNVASRQEIGTHVTVGTAGTITTLYYYRTNGAAANTVMRLWDGSGTLIEQVTIASGSQGAQGWQPFALTTPHPVNAGDQLTVSVTWEIGSSSERYDNPISPAGAADFPQWYEVFNATPGSFPTGSGYQGETRAVDLFLQTGETPATPGDLANQLAAWLSTTDGTHADSAPLQDHTTLATVRNVVGSTTGQLDATKAVSDTIHDLLTATNKNLGTLWDLAGHLTDLELAAYKALLGSGSARLTGPNSAGGSAFYTADGNLVSQLVAETWQRVRVLRGDIGFGTDGWTMTAETDFEDAVAFAEPADAYTLHITSYQPTQAASTSPAGLWLPRIGWWCILTGAHASQRQFVDFEQQLLSDQGHRMPGCAIQLKPGTLATVQAWLLA